MQGALLLQSWLKMSHPHNAAPVESLALLPASTLEAYGKSSISSHVLDVAFTHDSISPKLRRKLILKLVGHYHVLADDRIGSRVVDKIWASSDVFLKVRTM